MRVEIHPGEGGEDAAMFAVELGDAIAASSGGRLVEGRVVTVEAPHRL